MLKFMPIEEKMKCMPDYETDTQRCLDWLFDCGEFAPQVIEPPTNKKIEKQKETSTENV